jgi:excinuclease ABC subunit C
MPVDETPEVPTSSPAPSGQAVLEQALPNLPLSPGVYRMLDGKGDVLYVGKARAIRKRVAQYTQTARLPERLRRMVFETRRIEVITTASEAEALLLEANLIKRLRPRFNIFLRDDKSYPWLMVSDDHPHPQIAKHRGERRKGASYYGPFASVWAVNQTITALQRVFLLRTCRDTVFESRDRPCLLYQIKRCSAPCVDRISREDYGALVAEAKQFLAGEVPSIQKRLAAEMEAAAAALEFERAASLRDRIRGLTHIQGNSRINLDGVGDADVVALHMAAGQSCVQVFFFRGGRNNGNRPYFLTHSKSDITPEEVMASFLAQLYDDLPPPPLVLTSHEPPEAPLVAEALAIKAGRRVELHRPQRGDKRAIVEHAETNAREALERRLAESTAQGQLLEGVQRLLDLPDRPERIEVYDNSHIMGTNAYGAMIVGGPQGFVKSAYRKFAIKEAKAGDDFGMMREVLERRFARALKEDPSRTGEGWPDLVVIDGGQGQLSAAAGVMEELGLHDIPLISMAKGPDRDAGREWFFMAGREPFQLPPRDPVLYYLQRLRDEAHRFVIGSHRAGRAKALTKSELDDIPGVGPAVKRRLLNHFGSARGVRQAGEVDLANCPGVGPSLARRIHQHFHPGLGQAT